MFNGYSMNLEQYEKAEAAYENSLEKCDKCGQGSEVLYNINGETICEECLEFNYYAEIVEEEIDENETITYVMYKYNEEADSYLGYHNEVPVCSECGRPLTDDTYAYLINPKEEEIICCCCAELYKQ
jgi:hypothetical protein